MTKKQLKRRLIEIRNGAMITPVLEEIYNNFNCPNCDQVGFHKCKECGKEITREECEYDEGKCIDCL